MKWIRNHLPVHPVSALPTHVVVFDSLAPKISDFLSIYKPIDIFFHADTLLTNRGGKNVILYERVDTTQQPTENIKTEDEVEEIQEL
jgi:phosphatidylinositol glycan class B